MGEKAQHSPARLLDRAWKASQRWELQTPTAAEDIAAFTAYELQGFFGHLGNAFSAFAQGQPVPAAVFDHDKGKTTGSRAARGQRKGKADKP